MKKISCLLLILLLCSCFRQKLDSRALYRDSSRPVDERVEDLLNRMTLDEKIGQMTQVERKDIKELRMTVAGRRNVYSKKIIAKYGLGSVFSEGGSAPGNNTPREWADMVDSFQDHARQSRLGIPVIYGTDGVHGHGNLRHATIFPHNIGLGAAGNEKLVEEIGRITALEIAATGVHWNFAPCVAVPQDERWGRTYEGYSEDPRLVNALGAAYVRGLQSTEPPVMATAKHFVADGGTLGGVDRGNAVLDNEKLALHLLPYKGAIAAGVKSIMISYSSVNGIPMHANRELISELLVKKMGFEGIVVSDLGALEFLPGSPVEQVELAINAGVDMVMVADFGTLTLQKPGFSGGGLPSLHTGVEVALNHLNYRNFITCVKQNVKSGKISMERINEAVRRILRVKFELGLFDDSWNYRHLMEKVGSEEHREVARQAVRESLVLLKNERGILPLGDRYKKIWLTGLGADDLGSQCGGWTLTWQGMRGTIQNGHTVLRALQETLPGGVEIVYSETPVEDADIVIFVTCESPYAEGMGDKLVPEIFLIDQWQFDRIKNKNIPIVSLIISGRPLLLGEVENKSDALLACWLPGTEGLGIADVLWGNYSPTGKLPITWPENREQFLKKTGKEGALYPFGFGLTY